MRDHLKVIQTKGNDAYIQGNDSSVSYYSVDTQCQQQCKPASAASRGSIRAVKAKLDAVYLDIELEKLKKQAKLKAQLDQMQLELQLSELELQLSELEIKKQKLKVGAEMLEKFDFNEGEEREKAL